MGRDKNININRKYINRAWKKLILTLMDDFEGFKALVKEVTANVVKIVRELELEVEPEDVNVLLQSHDKT